MKPFLFKRAQDLWDKNQLNKNYKIKLNDLKSEIRRHGTYSALILARDEAKKREELAREEKKKEALEKEEERRHREQGQKTKELEAKGEKELAEKQKRAAAIKKIIELFRILGSKNILKLKN